MKFSSLFNFGISDKRQDFVNAAVRTSNQFALIFFAIGVFYASFSAILFPSVVFNSILLAVFSLLSLFLNRIGFINLSRFLLSLSSSFLVAQYTAMLTNPGEEIILPLYAGQLVVAIMPWVYIDIREKVLLIISVVFTYSIFFALPYMAEFYDMNIDNEILRTGVMSGVTYGFVFIALSAALFLINNRNVTSEKQAKEFLSTIEEKNKAMEEQQNELKKTIEEVNKAREEDNKRSWVSQGLSELGNILRDDKDDKLYERMIKHLVEFTDVNQGGMYFLDEAQDGHEVLSLKSLYAYHRNKFEEQQIEIGDGLIGQCFLEKETILLTEVPDNYTRITSGLGEATPTCVCIVPMKNEDNVEGVIEVAAFEKLDGYKVEFLEKAGEAISVFIRGYKTNYKTKELLEQSQQQTEEMRAQEEEMRQNMEELQATQEELQRKENEYVQRIEELEKELNKLA
jgi:putative methionine-R-sulfoxide reductase with GAF domain